MSQEPDSNAGSDTPERPTPATSTVAIPITVTAAFLEQKLDAVLDGIEPGETGLLYQHADLDIGHGLTGTAQVWRRSNSHIVMAGDTINATLPVRVVLLPSWKPHLGSLSLPIDINLPLDISAEYTVRMQARPQLDAGYDLRLHATFDYEVDRPVGIEAAGVGLTLTGATRTAAEEALHSLGTWLNSDRFDYLNFRADVERGWLALQQPVALSPGHHVRLEIAPASVYSRAFRSRGETGILGLAVVARIRALAAADTPTTAVPLPPVSAGAPAAGVEIVLPLEISFASLEAALQENVANHPWHIDGRQVLLRAVQVTGDDAGELQARVDIMVTSESGGFEVEASLSASGKPRLDIAEQRLSLDDFHYDVHTDSTLLNIAATLLRPFAGAILQPWLSLPLAPQAERLLTEVNERLATGIVLADGVTLHGNAGGVRLTGLAVHAQGLAVMVETHGDLEVEIDHPSVDPVTGSDAATPEQK